jgi:hypothetical protein
LNQTVGWTLCVTLALAYFGFLIWHLILYSDIFDETNAVLPADRKIPLFSRHVSYREHKRYFPESTKRTKSAVAFVIAMLCLFAAILVFYAFHLTIRKAV